MRHLRAALPVNPVAVNWVKDDQTRPPKHNYDRCIRCFCCQEMCQSAAITIEQTLLGRIMGR